MSSSTESATPLDALIIGAGFAGLYQLHSLRDRLGMRAQVLEAGGGVGGTWYWNRYPGARCDSESHSYMFYFDERLVQGWEWSQRYPGQAEILRYLDFVTDTLDLRRDITFNARVNGAEWDEAARLWRVRTEDGRQYAARYLVTAVGCLSSANLPQIPGLEDFQGDWYHTGQWPHEGVDFTGKRVGVIGTGATGIQAIPVIAQTAAQVTVFQRTANYSIPARNQPLTPEFKREIKQNATQIYATMRKATNGHAFLIDDRLAVATPEDARQAIYDKAWEVGGLRFRAVFKDILVDQAANDTAADFIKDKIRQMVKDPVKAEVLADIDHPFAAKRPPIDTNYFDVYNRDNVHLVDLRATPIERITQAGIRTSDQEHPLDIIVFATGFDAMTGGLFKLNIAGTGGQKLQDYWYAGPRTNLGLQVPGFPNLFTITGPGSPSVLCNLPPQIEQHVEWISACLKTMQQKGLDRIETTEEAAQQWGEEVERAARATLLFGVKHSWYLGANVPGKPRVFMPYAGGFDRYQQICNQVAADGYTGFAIS
jgi:cation diffusion facilitator CzcD-associated flavoprotein CzcO